MKLSPEHLADLKRSGLADKTITEAGIESVSPDRINKRLGFNIPGLNSMYQIPYGDSYARYKVFYAQGEEYYKDGRAKPKYLCRKESGNRLYIPKNIRLILDDVSTRIYITEGEKKALKTTQEGLNCIAISGLWNWKNKDSDDLIEDFNLINLNNRTVYLIPDSDWIEPDRQGNPKNLKDAIKRLAHQLIDSGAKVFVIYLPASDNKIGLDDYLVSHSVEEFKSLPSKEIRKLTIQELISEFDNDSSDIKEIIKRIAEVTNESERALYTKQLHDKSGIPTRAIQKDIKKYSDNANTEDTELVISANFKGLIDVIVDDSGTLIYLVKDGTSLKLTNSLEIESITHIPPEKKHLPFAIPQAKKVLKWYVFDNDKELFKDILRYLERFSYLPYKQRLIIVCKIFLTYIQDRSDIHYLPYILFYAVPERGKSRTGKAVTYISYRGVHLVELREANLFRYAENLKATIFFDIMDLWQKAVKNGAEDILLLRCEKGAKATRVIYPEKGAFRDTMYYDIYGATLMATNEPVHKILDSRCIAITMENRPGNYENPSLEKAQEIKERLAAWRARIIDSPLPAVEPIEDISGRLWDISRPLLQVCKLVNPAEYGNLINALKKIARQRIEDKKASIEGIIIERLFSLSEDTENIPEWTVETAKLLELINEDRPDKYKLSPQGLGKKLKAMGIKTRKIHGYSEIILNRTDFNILLTQYGLKEENNNIYTHTPAETLPNSTTGRKQDQDCISAGRELVESESNSTQTLPTQSLENTESLNLVENGRELSDGGKDIKNNSNVRDLIPLFEK